MATTLYDQSSAPAKTFLAPVVTDAGGLTVDVASFKYVQSTGELASYAGASGVSVTASSVNYLYLDSGGSLTVSVTGYPSSAHRSLARVTTSGSAVAVIVSDLAKVQLKMPLGGVSLPVLPSAPSAVAGKALLCAKEEAGTDVLSVSWSGGSFSLQQWLGTSTLLFWTPGVSAGWSSTSVGTASFPTLDANYPSSCHRRLNVLSAAGADSAAENYNASLYKVWFGNAAGRGGFMVKFRFAIWQTSTNCRGFFGLLDTITATSVTQVPSALTNCVGVTWDATETTLRIGSNDASGSMTRSDLGANFPVDSSRVIYCVTLYAKPNGNSVSYRVVKEADGATAEAVASGLITSDLPSNTTFLSPHMYMNNGGDAVAVSFDFLYGKIVIP